MIPYTCLDGHPLVRRGLVGISSDEHTWGDGHLPISTAAVEDRQVLVRVDTVHAVTVDTVEIKGVTWPTVTLHTATVSPTVRFLTADDNETDDAWQRAHDFVAALTDALHQTITA